MKITAINLSNINKAVTGVTETVRKSKLLIDDISEKIGKTNERIKTKISDSGFSIFLPENKESLVFSMVT